MAHHVELEDVQTGAVVDIEIPYKPSNLKIASVRLANAYSKRQKFSGSPALHLSLVESNVPCFKI